MSKEGEPEPPENHPKPNHWWETIKNQSWFCYVAIALEIPALIVWGIGEHGALPLAILNVGLAAGACANGAGTTLVDTMRAWAGDKT